MNEPEPIRRSYTVDLQIGDGRTVIGRCVPYGEAAEVSDGGPPYLEIFARGAFRGCVKAPNRVWLNVEHSDLMANQVGWGTELVERDDGLHGTFRLTEESAATNALAFIRAGALTGLSIEAIPNSPARRGPNGEVIRTNCRLRSVALCREPAYAGAQVTAVRSLSQAPRTIVRPARNVELDARIAAWQARQK